MWEFMENHHPSVFVKDYDEGITRVKRGGYAFLMESTMLDYVVQVRSEVISYSVLYGNTVFLRPCLARLQPDSDRRSAGLKGLRDRDV